MTRARWRTTGLELGDGVNLLACSRVRPYEGLSAYVVCDCDAGPMSLTAGIIEGDLPEPPEVD